MKITLRLLRSMKACATDREALEEVGPEGVELTRENISRLANWGFDLNWFGEKVWGGAYCSERQKALETYCKAEADAEAAYFEQRVRCPNPTLEECTTRRATVIQAVGKADATFRAAIKEIVFNLAQNPRRGA